MQQQTSIAANNRMNESGAKMNHKEKIYQALKKCKSGTFERIAYFASLTESQVWKRMSELESEGKVKKTGTFALLSSGSKGEVWQIVETPQPKVQIELFKA